MYIITNRNLRTRYKSLAVFGATPSEKGPNELRLVEVTEDAGKWKVNTLQDKLSKREVSALKKKHSLSLDEDQPQYASLRVACQLFERAQRERRSILFYVHGYNNDIEDIIKTARALEELYGVIVVPFSWPANGGGPISGTAAYLNDKKDARVSVDAFNRFVKKIHEYHLLLLEGRNNTLFAKAQSKHPTNPEAAAELYANLISKDCDVRLSLLCHSMGNYLLKRALTTSETQLHNLLFHNICLVAADTNNEGHAQWVDKLDVNNRIYVVINENDNALRASRIKLGKEQRERLGHAVRYLDSRSAHYLDLTDFPEVGTDHSYFKGDPVARNPHLKALFIEMFSGRTVENAMRFHAQNNSYRYAPATDVVA